MDLSKSELKLYTRVTVIIFTIFLTGLAGALMLAYNLREIGKKQGVWALIIITLIADGILFQVLNRITLDNWLRYFVPNMIAALILGFPIWNIFLKKVDIYKPKAIWIPLICLILFYGSLIIGNYLISKHT